MNYTIAAADRATHFKIVAIALAWATAVMIVAIMLR